jgi:hypothetical protein
MSTAADLIQAALEEMKVYAPGETVSTADMARALDVLNRMVDTWSNMPLACFEIVERSKLLTIGDSDYTIGSGGDINVTRPLRLLKGPGAAYILDTNSNRYDVEVVERDVWNSIANLTVTSQVPNTLFYDPQYPLGIIYLWPVPLVAYTLYFDAMLPFSTFATSATAVSLPPGYEDAIVHNLAVRLWPFFKAEGVLVDQLVLEMAKEGLGIVKRTNIREVEATYDDAIVAAPSGTYNIYTDRQGSR